MAGHFSKGLCAATFLSLTMVVVAGGCGHPRSTPESAAVSNDVSNALIGKQITVRGKFSLWGKVGPYIVLDSQRQLYLYATGAFTWGKPYSEMDGKLVEATGTLRFYHEPPAKPTDPSGARLRDFFYFEAETAQVRLIGH
jgi:hypothetical protein